MAKNEEENENILPRLGEELEKVLMAEKYNLTTKNGKEHEKIQSWIKITFDPKKKLPIGHFACQSRWLLLR